MLLPPGHSEKILVPLLFLPKRRTPGEPLDVLHLSFCVGHVQPLPASVHTATQAGRDTAEFLCHWLSRIVLCLQKAGWAGRCLGGPVSTPDPHVGEGWLLSTGPLQRRPLG